MANNVKVRMMVSRGNPSTGTIVRAGALVELSEFWAQRFIAEGAAIAVDAKTETPQESPATVPAKKGKKTK